MNTQLIINLCSEVRSLNKIIIESGNRPGTEVLTSSPLSRVAGLPTESRRTPTKCSVRRLDSVRMKETTFG